MRDREAKVPVPFRLGDVVTISSGGAVMTIAEVTAGQARCIWFSRTHQGLELREGSFPLATLREPEPEP